MDIKPSIGIGGITFSPNEVKAVFGQNPFEMTGLQIQALLAQNGIKSKWYADSKFQSLFPVSPDKDTFGAVCPPVLNLRL